MQIKKLLSISIVLLVLLVPASFVYSQDDNQDEIDEIQKNIDKYEKKISELQGKASTLQGEVDYLDTQIGLTELKIRDSTAKIQKTENEVKKLSSNIDDLKGRISKLEDSIDYQKGVLASRMRERYKSKDDSPLLVLFGSNTLDRMIEKLQYLKVMEVNDNKLISEMANTKEKYDTQKNLYEEKKQEQQDLRVRLEGEKANLDNYKQTLVDQNDEKKQLLEVTQNDEAKYQQLLEEARSQLASFSNFTSSAGGGVISSNGFGKGKEGWYYSQRDETWASRGIGSSRDSVLNVGCLVTSVAMVYKSYGSKVTPADIAKDTSRYFSNTAMMLIPWKGPSGKSYTSISVSQIDGELSKGHPVIVGLYAGPYGTHFVVLADKKDGDYVLYDPWYGPDLKFSSRYSKSSIFQAVVFK